MSEKREEDEQVLCPPNKSRSRLIALGALNLLKRGRTELLSALFASCLLAATFVVLILLAAFLTLSSDAPCSRYYHRYNNGPSTNIYFVKHENRTWTSEELCYIETAARHYPDFNIFMINLINENTEIENKRKYFDELVDKTNFSTKKDIVLYENTENSEVKLRSRLSNEIPNVRNINISVKSFFSRSRMSKKINDLSSDRIELAAKFQTIWDSPGISLEPFNIDQLKTIKDFRNEEVNEFASIQIDNDLQATSVPCQSFIGFVIGEMAEYDFTNRQTLLKRSLAKFCPSDIGCAGVRIVDPIFKEPHIFTTCPTIDFIVRLENESYNDPDNQTT